MIGSVEELSPLRIASVADDGRDDEPGDEPTETGASLDQVLSDAKLDELCEHLAWWCATRKLYGAPRGPVSLLGKLRGGSRPLRNDNGGPDAACSAELAALYIAMLAQPAEALDRVVFVAHYFHRITNVKATAAAIGVGRQHYYTLLKEFRRRIFSASREILGANEREFRALRERGAGTAFALPDSP